MIRRAPREKGFTVLQNDTLEDTRLSWEALGLLSFLLTKPDDWTVSKQHLISCRRAGDHKIKRILGELQDAGYLSRERKQDEEGKFVWESVVYDTPRRKGESIPRKSIDGSSIDGSSIDGKPPDITKKDGNEHGNNKEGCNGSGSGPGAGARVSEVWDFLPEEHQDVSADVKDAYQEYKDGRVDLPMLARRYLTRNGSTAPTATIKEHAQEHPTPKVVAAYVVAGIKADSNPTSYASTILDENWTRTDDGQTEGSFADQYAKHRAAARRGAGLDG